MILEPINSTDFNGELDLNNVGSSVLWSLGGIYDTAYVQLTMVSGALPATPVITVQVSVDGVSFEAPPAGAVTYNSLGLKAAITVTGFVFLRLVVTTEAGTGGERILATLNVETTRG